VDEIVEETYVEKQTYASMWENFKM
jgi:hypothetical protein